MPTAKRGHAPPLISPGLARPLGQPHALPQALHAACARCYVPCSFKQMAAFMESAVAEARKAELAKAAMTRRVYSVLSQASRACLLLVDLGGIFLPLAHPHPHPCTHTHTHVYAHTHTHAHARTHAQAIHLPSFAV